MTHTDAQLKQALAKMLPDLLEWYDDKLLKDSTEVLDTELLHLCWLVEETIPRFDDDSDQVYINNLGVDDTNGNNYYELFDKLVHASWQQRVIALAKVKGIDI